MAQNDSDRMKCPVCDKEMVFISRYKCWHKGETVYCEVNEIYHCYNHDNGGGAVYLHLKWQEYTRDELDND